MVIVQILTHESFQMPFMQYDHVIQQVPSATPHPTLGDSVLPWTAKGCSHGLASQALGKGDHVATELRIMIEQQKLWAGAYGQASRSCCMIQRPFGFLVTFRRRILRRSWLMTKKQYKTRKVSVGTVKKSMATIAWRWLRRKLSQCGQISGLRGPRRSQRETVGSDPWKPSLSNSP